MPEYSLILGLVVVFSIAAVIVLSGSISDVFSSNSVGIADASLSEETRRYRELLAENGEVDLATLLSDSGYTGETRTLSFPLSNGQTITIDNYPVDLDTTLETVGSNGTTHILASLMRELTSQLVDAGEITETQAINLLELANQGHQIARVEDAMNAQMLEIASMPLQEVDGEYDYFNHFSDLRGYADFEGEGIIVERLNDKLYTEGFEYDYSADRILQSTEAEMMYSSQFMKNFITSYQTAETDGSLNNPAVRSLVNTLAQDIVTITKGAYITMMEPDVLHADPARYLLETASRTTDQHSGTICVIGGDEDSGISCS